MRQCSRSIRFQSTVRSHKRTSRPGMSLVEQLEGRCLLSTFPGIDVQPALAAQFPGGFGGSTGGGTDPGGANPASAGPTTPPKTAYTPAQIQSIYGFNTLFPTSTAYNSNAGAGTTIAIVDAYDYPTVQHDLDTFSAQFGLPTTTVTRVNQTGGTALPGTDPTGGWELEEA